MLFMIAVIPVKGYGCLEKTIMDTNKLTNNE